MNTNSYVGYFEEISQLQDFEQEEMLEKARHLAFTKHGLTGRYTVYLMFSFLFTFVIGITPTLIIGFSILTTGLSIGIGFIGSYYLFRHFNGKLIKVGLLDLLNESIEKN